MFQNIFILLASLFFVIKGASLSTKYAERLAESYRLSKYTVGFIVVAIISILPETFISLSAAQKGMPAFGLGTLFGSNVADLTLIIAIIVAFAGRGLKVESKVLKKNTLFYPLLLAVPLILGLDGFYSRIDGAGLLFVGLAFFLLVFKSGRAGSEVRAGSDHRAQKLLFLLVGMGMLVLGANFTVSSAAAIAQSAGINPILIGMLVVGLGTTMPELFFAARSARKNNDSLAVGDILGTVLADATVVVGLLALISPFAFPVSIIYVTGVFMLASSLLLFYFMRSGRVVSKREAFLLFLFWLLFVAVEFVSNT